MQVLGELRIFIIGAEWGGTVAFEWDQGATAPEFLLAPIECCSLRLKCLCFNCVHLYEF